MFHPRHDLDDIRSRNPTKPLCAFDGPKTTGLVLFIFHSPIVQHLKSSTGQGRVGPQSSTATRGMIPDAAQKASSGCTIYRVLAIFKPCRLEGSRLRQRGTPTLYYWV